MYKPNLNEETLNRAADISYLIQKSKLKEAASSKENNDGDTKIIREIGGNKVSPKDSKIYRSKLDNTLRPQVFTLPQRIPNYEAIKDQIDYKMEEQKQLIALRQEVVESQKLSYFEMMNEQSRQNEAKLAAEREKLMQLQNGKEQAIKEKSIEKSMKAEKELLQEFRILHQQKENAILSASLIGVQQRQQRFYGKYDDVVKLLYALDPKSPEASEYNARLKEALHAFEQIIKNAKQGKCGCEELKAAELSCTKLVALEEDLRNAILKSVQLEKERLQQYQQQQEQLQKQQQQELREKQEQQQQQQEDAARKQQEAEEAARRSAALEAQNLNVPGMVNAPPPPPQQQQQQQQQQQHQQHLESSQSIDTTDVNGTTLNQGVLQKYSEILTFYQEKVERVKPLQVDENFKKFRVTCKKTINIPINAISALTPQHLQDKFERLYCFFCGQPTPEMIRITDHPLGRDYSLLLMAKKFVTQGETEISSNPIAAFAVASIIVTFWKIIPEFGKLFLAYLYKASPILVPYYTRRRPEQSIEEYNKSLGYDIVDGQMETAVQFLKRQSGVIRLYAAVMVTYGRQADGPAHPHSLSNGWNYLTNIMNMEPIEDICATALSQMLQIIAEPMYMAYGKQFLKLLYYMQTVYLPRLAAVDNGGPRSRLETILSSILKDRQITKPQGMLQPGYW